MACTIHPAYSGVRKPKSTDKLPGGCSDCWKIYNEKNGEVEAPTIQTKKKADKPARKSKVQERPIKKTHKRVPIETKLPAPLNESAPEAHVCSCSSSVAPAPLNWEDVRETFKVELDAMVEEVAKRKIAEARVLIGSELSVEYEHLFIYDADWHPKILKALEKEGWQWMSHSWPLASKGILAKDYTLMKRIKKSGQVVIPDLEDEKVKKRYMKL
jgi:hypothetical protein